MLCLSCCLIFPLPETILYDLPDSLSDLQSMGRTTGNSEKNDELTTHPTHYHMIDPNTFTFPRTTTSNLNDLNPKTILRSQQQQQQQQQGNGRDQNLSIRSQPEIIQLHSASSSLNGLSNPCYFASYNDTIDRYDIDQQQQQLDNRVRISIRGAHNNNNNNNNNNNTRNEQEETKF